MSSRLYDIKTFGSRWHEVNPCQPLQSIDANLATVMSMKDRRPGVTWSTAGVCKQHCMIRCPEELSCSKSFWQSYQLKFDCGDGRIWKGICLNTSAALASMTFLPDSFSGAAQHSELMTPRVKCDSYCSLKDFDRPKSATCAVGFFQLSHIFQVSLII